MSHRSLCSQELHAQLADLDTGGDRGKRGSSGVEARAGDGKGGDGKGDGRGGDGKGGDGKGGNGKGGDGKATER